MGDDNQDMKAAGSDFTRLLLQNQKRIYGLILSLVPNGPDADDIMQDACAVMWQKFDTFEPGTNFPAWALRIARYQVMTYYNRSRRARARLSDESLDAIADTLAEARIDKAERVEVLNLCLSKLSDGNREMIRQRYTQDKTVDAISEDTGRSIHAVYKALNRTHEALLRCMRTNLNAGLLS
jgi:RNA polymerase sigma-70 factor (ECF subfamily)